MPTTYQAYTAGARSSIRPACMPPFALFTFFSRDDITKITLFNGAWEKVREPHQGFERRRSALAAGAGVFRRPRGRPAHGRGDGTRHRALRAPRSGAGAGRAADQGVRDAARG